MKAYRNIAGEVREIQVDIGINGQPILPPDTTVDPRPEPLPGHYVTVVGDKWVQIEIPVYVEAFETKKQKKLDAIAKYRDWYLDQPVEFQGVKFDGDSEARIRLTQALLMAKELEYVPPVWVTYDNSEFPLPDFETMKDLVAVVTQAFSTRFYECSVMRAQAMAAEDLAALDAVQVPAIPDRF